MKRDLYSYLRTELTASEKAQLVGHIISSMASADQLYFAAEFMNYGMSWDNQKEGWQYWNKIHNRLKDLSREAEQ